MNGLEDWLARLEQAGPAPIALGLERVSAVAERLFGGPPLDCPVLTVGGTNGKGSVVHHADALLRAAGLRTGRYTSPHLLRFNERIALDGHPVRDRQLIAAFEAVQAAQADTELTYFEYTTLAALWLFARSGLDAVVLEVGLGGRLDAVNLVDADVAVITSIDLDHQAWLGPDRDAIGYEKAGIARPGRPLLLGERDPPWRLLQTVSGVGARLLRLGIDYEHGGPSAAHRLRLPDGRWIAMQPPTLAGRHQWDNLATALVAVHELRPDLILDDSLQSRALAGRPLAGRLQRVSAVLPAYVDVAHNAQAAAALADWWSAQAGQRHAVFGLLADKDLPAVVAPLLPLVECWHPVQLRGPRARPVAAIADALRELGAKLVVHADPRPSRVWSDLMMDLAAQATADAGPSVVAFGSFLLVADILALAGDPVGA